MVGMDDGTQSVPRTTWQGIGDLLLHLGHGGDQRSWEDLVGRCGDRFYRICQAIVQDPMLAEDAVQETFLHIRAGAWRFRLRGEDPDAEARRWLQRVCTNCAISLLRKQQARRNHEHLTSDPAAGQAAPGARSEDPRIEDMLANLRCLPDNLRQALELRYLAGLDGDDLAAALDCSRVAARSRVHRALEHLRQRLVPPGAAVALGSLGHLLSDTTPALGMFPSELAKHAWLGLYAHPGATLVSSAAVFGGSAKVMLGLVGGASLLVVATGGGWLAMGPPPAVQTAPTIVLVDQLRDRSTVEVSLDLLTRTEAGGDPAARSRLVHSLASRQLPTGWLDQEPEAHAQACLALAHHLHQAGGTEPVALAAVKKAMPLIDPQNGVTWEIKDGRIRFLGPSAGRFITRTFLWQILALEACQALGQEVGSRLEKSADLFWILFDPHEFGLKAEYSWVSPQCTASGWDPAETALLMVLLADDIRKPGGGQIRSSEFVRQILMAPCFLIRTSSEQWFLGLAATRTNLGEAWRKRMTAVTSRRAAADSSEALMIRLIGLLSQDAAKGLAEID